MTAIQTIKLEKKYKGKTAVNKIDLSIETGELFSLLGVNGAGKTTTIKMLSCAPSRTSISNSFRSSKHGLPHS